MPTALPLSLPRADAVVARRFGWVLGGLVVGALAVRLVVAFGLGLPYLIGDAYAYLRMAEGIRLGTPVGHFPNGYPLVIAAMQTVLGEGASIPALRLLNVLASAAAAGLAGLIGQRLGGPAVGLAVALGVAVYPNQLNYSRFLLTEPLTTVLLLGGVLLLLRRRPGPSGAMLYGVTLLRSSYLPALGLFAVLLAVCRDGRALLRLVGGAALVAALYGGLVLGGVVAPSANLSANWLIAAQAESHEGVDYDTSGFSAEERAQPLRTYLAGARDAPTRFLARRASAFWGLWGATVPVGDGPGQRSLGAALLIGLRFPLFVLAMLGLVRYRRARAVWIVALPILSVTAVHTVFFSTHRFIVPVEPLALVLAVLAVAPGLYRAATGRRAEGAPPA